MTTDNCEAEILKDLAQVLTAEGLRTLVLLELNALREDLRLVRPLIDTRQATLGFLSVEAAKVQDDLIRKERRDRPRHAQEGIKVSGPTPAPGSISAFSLLAEWADLLADIEHSTTTRLLRVGVCHVASRPGDETEPARYQRVVELIGVLDRDKYLRRVHNDLIDLHARVTKCVEGNPQKRLPDPCPWCGRKTLVVDLTTWVATCGQDPDTGEFEVCICSDSYCLCKTKPRDHRHTWHQAHPRHKATSLDGLARAIAHRPDPTTEQDQA